MKKFLIFISLLCVCEAGVYAQSSADEKNANRENRRAERLERRAKHQEKKSKNKVESTQEDLVVTIEQEQPTPRLNEVCSDNIVVESQDNVHDSATLKVETTPSEAESNTKIVDIPAQSKNKEVDSIEPIQDSQTSSDDNAFYLFIIIIVAIVALKWIFSGRCKKCGKLWAMRTIDEQYLGRSKTKIKKDNQGKPYQVHYNNIKVTRQCKHCGYTTSCVEEREG